jgi:hypothetical protein
MAAVATAARRAPAEGANRVVHSAQGDAQGIEGRYLGDGASRAAERWRGGSAYVADLLNRGDRATASTRTLAVAGSLAAGSIGLALGGSFLGLGQVLFPAALVAGLAAYAYLARWLARRGDQHGVLGFAERVRRCLAYEGDPKARQ